MTTRYEKYRIKNGISAFSEKTMNPIFQDIDLRIASLENLEISWNEAVDAVTQFGLLRINEIIGPLASSVTASAAAVEEKRQTAETALAALQTAIADFESEASGDITAWKAAKITELDAWRASLTAELPAIDARLDALEANPVFLSYENRATLRNGTPDQDKMALIDGLGLFVFHVGSDEPDDDESCFATSNGRWLLEAPSWDLVDCWQQPEYDDREVLYGSGISGITSISALSQASFTISVPGAILGDMSTVMAPNALTAGISVFSRVTANNTVTVYLNNPSASTQTLTSGTFTASVIKPT